MSQSTSELLAQGIRDAVANAGGSPELAEELIAFARERGREAREARLSDSRESETDG